MAEGTGRSRGLNARWAQMARQRQVIEYRRQLLLQRQANENRETSPSPLNAFSNDGSFLDKFKKLSETKNVKKSPVKPNFIPKPSTVHLDSTKSDSNSKADGETKNIDEEKFEAETTDHHRSRKRSRSHSRERKCDSNRISDDKRNRFLQKWNSGKRNSRKRNSRKRSYSSCTPVIEEMPFRNPTRFNNIVPQQTNPPNTSSNFTNPQSNANFNVSNVNVPNTPNTSGFNRQIPNVSTNQMIHHIRPNFMPKLPSIPPPNILPPHLGSGFNERIGISLPPPIIIHNIPAINNINLNTPPPTINKNIDFSFRLPNVPLHKIPEPKPLNAIMIPPPKPLDAVSIPKPKPLDAITIPPPKPMNLHAIPPPSPICLTQIPKPKEIDLRSIPHPPTSNVLSTDGRLSPTMEAAAKQVAQNGDSWELTLISDSARADSMWYLSKTQSAEYKLYRSLVMKYRNEIKISSCDIDKSKDADDINEKYEPEFSMQDDSSDEDNTHEEISQINTSTNEVLNKGPSLIKMHFDKSKCEQKDVNLIQNSKNSDWVNTITDSEDENNEKDEKKEKKMKRRKSRWGDSKSPIPDVANVDGNISSLPGLASVTGLGVSGMININPQPISSNQPQLTKITRSDTGLIQYAMKTYGNTNLSEEDWKKCEDHYKISLLYQEMLIKRRQIEKLTAAGRFKYEYDSDEEIDDTGTWEHRLRQQEMEATQRWACELTRQANGKHHIGDFLPPDELKRFMDKYSSVKGGKEPDLSDYKEFKLKEDNIGFKMLQKLGWSEGEGLGADGSGITDPVNKSNQRDANQGLGVDQADSLAEGDDEFDAYRKRMMLAYRFRPNPLNNPRRPYY